ncbi:DNA-binding PadR family transcriptional regulator [Clostridium saccharoperbutylacetonicum]|uniref:Transcriptional regulator, PadR family n=1 Tax=Clostridium saccharoperbutylacetonicum N1-4(HMT) TaxID=931276 RepID=M1MP19_9CLOT|nr:PadR family transcriptional regulator [Clostridium saccharoperbutylacetonicum]AGF57958.1 transcriptional regulator, PadR family [Clostridium saccharoperbutylacetonicum N1-4(HMT)]NRT61269.1 DNA-binding PadR family transcriptional regulator [Clostridium saccharoperbutylacetonicum]NSB24586.1 DNA-binding PadR family transcriptional regulator [Clostridium saccharoperbutylacetonicum]NSB43961.1 DNA-binding PadR family transcriptional regulator [Clostridium saccharoperbutylacetonicum]
MSIKPTHGYEIQKFIQVNKMDSWTKIQSGSIYYALSKLEKEGLIILAEEIGSGTKARKIYSITEKGKKELKELVKQELSHHINEIGSDKFIIYPLLNTLDKNSISDEIIEHIEKLNNQKIYLEKWQKVKVNQKTLEIEKIAFQMMISNLEYQIKWHNALIENIDDCVEASNEITNLIAKFDFSNAKEIEVDRAENIENLKYEILNNPDTAPEKLEELIKALRK